MAVLEQTPYIEYVANGNTTSFALGFDCESKDHLIVLVDDVEPVVGAWSFSNGAVVFNTAPAAGKKITLQRNTPFSRTTDYQSYNNSFRPPAVNKDFDWIWWKLQELGVADWILGNRINALKNYVDRKDDELKSYLMEEIRKQGVALDQLDEYYNYLMERLAQIAVDKGWDASFVVDASGLNQQILNDRFKTYSNFYVTPENFYNPADGSDWYNAIQAAVDSRLPVQLAEKRYYISKAISVYDNTVLRGAGKDLTFIEKTTSEASSNGKDAIIYLNPLYSPWSPTLRKLDLYGFKLTRTFPNVGYGLYGEGLSLSTIQNFDLDGCRDGIHIVDSWQNVWIQCTASNGKPWFIERGTSNTFISCWSTDVSGDAKYGAPCYAWDIGGEGHTLIGCWADRVGTDGSPADAVWNFTRGSSITATTLGGEILHVKKLMNVSKTSVKIGNLFTWQFFNKYGNASNYGNFEISGGGSLNIQGGKIESEYTSATIPTGTIKPIFATIRNSGVLTLGQVELTDKITGVGDGSVTQIDHDGTGTVDIQGQTKYWESGNPTQKTVADSFKGKAGNNAKSIHSIDKVSLGKFGSSNAPVINMHSAGTEGFVNSRILAYGGSESTLGTIQIEANVFESTAPTNYFTGNLSVLGAYTNTTANAVNLSISSTGLISRSTSSSRFKKDIEDVNIDKSKEIVFNARPIWYRSTSEIDNPNHSYWGFIAEEVAEIDPRLVLWKTHDFVEFKTEGDDEGLTVKAVELEHPIPDGVAYDRFIPHLINVVKDLQRQLEEAIKSN